MARRASGRAAKRKAERLRLIGLAHAPPRTERKVASSATSSSAPMMKGSIATRPSSWLLVFAALLLLAFVVSLSGFFTLQPNEARVLVLFGDYKGTVRTRVGPATMNFGRERSSAVPAGGHFTTKK